MTTQGIVQKQKTRKIRPGTIRDLQRQEIANYYEKYGCYIILSETQKVILESYFGLNNTSILNTADLSLQFKVSGERIRQIRNEAIYIVQQSQESGIKPSYCNCWLLLNIDPKYRDFIDFYLRQSSTIAQHFSLNLLYETSIADIELSRICLNYLRKEGIETLGDILDFERGSGLTSILNIGEVLAELIYESVREYITEKIDFYDKTSII